MIPTLVMAASLGLLSTLHCWGMCGSLVAALQLGIPPALRAQAGIRLMLTGSYQAGRVFAYGLAGVLGGSVPALAGGLPPWAYRGLQTLAAISVVLAGLRLAGWLGRWPLLEAGGALIWRRLSPLTRALMPVDNPVKALASGMIWGFIPCGLVYAMLPVAAATGSASGGGLTMLAFGLGTLPGMLAASLLAGVGSRRLDVSQWRRPVGAAMAGLAIIWWVLQGMSGVAGSTMDHGAHLHHLHHLHAMPH